MINVIEDDSTLTSGRTIRTLILTSIYISIPLFLIVNFKRLEVIKNENMFQYINIISRILRTSWLTRSVICHGEKRESYLQISASTPFQLMSSLENSFTLKNFDIGNFISIHFRTISLFNFIINKLRKVEGSHKKKKVKPKTYLIWKHSKASEKDSNIHNDKLENSNLRLINISNL